MAGDRIALGIIRKAHGVRGEASVEVWSDSPDRFADLRAVTLVSPNDNQTRAAAIESVRTHAGRALVKFAGLESPEDVQKLQNWTVEIPEADARKLDADEYFLHDLIGLTLIDAGGEERGRVVEVEEGAGGVLLVVDGPRRRFDVPFAAEICTKVNLEAKTIVVSLPEGIEEL
ncbi:MAG TPA: ribosome maturation factor RimM [Thermoanaerobaculia bacterium]|jgi:16S rRNA processing protein RimM|nr:ribosome maturation factor RimM [Thermoanaerobaculia bacterium]